MFAAALCDCCTGAQRLASRPGEVEVAEGAKGRPSFGVPEGARVLDFLPVSQRGAEASWRLQRRGELAVALLLIAAVWAMAASRWGAADMVVPWDAKNQFYAFFRFLAASIHSGHTPFWNPYHYGGHPSIADPQSLIFAPAFVAWAWFDPTPSFRAFDLLVYAHLLVGGLSIGVLGWRARWPVSASVLAAAVFMFGGPASGRLQHTGVIISYGLFPLALLLMQVALDRRSLWAAAGFGVVGAMLALGRNHEALLLCFVLGAALAAQIASADSRRRFLRERAGVLATMVVVGMALLAIPLLLTLQFTQLSNRPHMPLESAYEASLYPANLASLAVANVMGSLESTADYWGPNFDTLPDVGATDRSFNYLFVSATATIVILWFGLAGGWLWRRGNRLMTSVLVLVTLYALGRYTPFYALAFQMVPGIDFFRRPIDATFVLVAAFALLCGPLLATYIREGIPPVSRRRLAIVAAAAFAIVAWAVLFSEKSNQGWTSFLQVLKVVPIAALVVTLLACARTAKGRVVAAACIAAVATAEFLWWSAASTLNAEGPTYYSALQDPQGEDAHALAILEREVAYRHRQGERPRVEIVGVGGAWQNLAVTRGLEATNGYNPLRIGAYDRLVSPGETTYLVGQRLFPKSFDSYDCVLARELGLEYLVLGRPIEQMPHLVRQPISETLLTGPKVWIYRLRGAEPRVRFVGGTTPIDMVARMPTAQPRLYPGIDSAIIDDDSALLRMYHPVAVRHVHSSARIRSWSPDRVEVEVDSDEAGTLTVHELDYPGWAAEVDGQPSPILRSDTLFRSVQVSAGRHLVVFRFAPLSFANLRDALLGLWASR
jgi:hypothetical protein